MSDTLPQPPSRLRSTLAAWLMGGLVLLTIAHGAGTGLPAWPAGLAAWGAALALWPRLDGRQRRSAGLLCGLGGVAAALSIWQEAVPRWSGVLTQNTPLLGMLAAVSFLQLIGLGKGAEKPLPTGTPAMWKTLLGVHLFGAVINMSVVFIMADRLARSRPLHERQAVVLSRGFLLAALWSPFYGAMAVALTYAPGAQLASLALAGLPLCGAALLLSGWLTQREMRRESAQGSDFIGYPMDFSGMWLPLALAAMVVAGHRWLPAWHSLAIISASAVLMSVLAALLMHGPVAGSRAVAAHAARRLPAMSGELVLFLSAGVFATGVQTLLQGGAGWLPFAHFGPLQAALLLAVMMSLAALGIHAVVTVVLASAWLAPLSPDPLLMAMVFLMTWGIGLSVNPMAGVYLSLQGRFGLPALRLARGNLLFCALAYGLSVVWLFVVAAWRGHAWG